MQIHTNRVPTLLFALLGAIVLAGTLPLARAQGVASLTTLYSFTGRADVAGSDGGGPTGELVQGADGNFYGTTKAGVGYFGTVFRITPAGALTTLCDFAQNESPTGLVRGSDNNFYGTTQDTVFRVSPGGVLSILHTLSQNDGGKPSQLALGNDGNLYGTTFGATSSGGSGGNGTVFRITPAGVFTTLYSFSGSSDGGNPDAGLVKASDGSFYGTTINGGGSNGTVFHITPTGTLTTLYRFPAGARSDVYGKLIQGSDGSFYGATSEGGTGYGTVFQFTATGVFTTLYSFAGGNDGGHPQSELIQANDGNFYGTTGSGGAKGYGTVFQITPTGVFTTLYSFRGTSDGTVPTAGLLQGSDGSLYGDTSSGGIDNVGTVFKLTLIGVHPAFFTGESALGNGVYYLAFTNGNFFGYYSYLTDPNYIYHFDMGYEYVIDAQDGKAGVYLYDFASGSFFYTSPQFPFPYLYDFRLASVLYYFADPSHAGHYNTNGVRYFFDLSTGTIISK